MSKFDGILDGYRATLAGTDFDDALLTAVTKGLGPSIYLADASLVSCSDKSETDRVKANFLIKKMEQADGPELDAAIADVCADMKGTARKARAVFYYQLVKKLGLEGKYA